MQTKKAAFIDHSFHKKTKATQFLIELLSKEYDIEMIWDESWNAGSRVSVEYLNREKFHTIFFFQRLPSLSYLKNLNCRNIVWFPMYDQEEYRHYSSYVPYLNLNIKMFSFSEKLYDKLKRVNLDCYYYKYHLKPVAQVLPNDETKKVFFWMRTSDITWDIVKKLLGENYDGKIIIKTTSDPNCKINLPSKEDIARYNIQIVNNWLNKEEYIKLLSSCNIFIAPRQFEGIGMSFIEALSCGMCVIAPNNSTMNEYIIHGRNGLLYNLKNPKELDLSNLAEMRKNTAKTAKEGYELWKKTKHEILIDLTKPNKKHGLMKLLYFQLIYVFLIPYVIWGKLKKKVLKFWKQKG